MLWRKGRLTRSISTPTPTTPSVLLRTMTPRTTGVPDSMTTTPTPEDVTVRLHKTMEAAVGLTPDDISNVQSLIDVGEWLVAFETLCTQIYEWELRFGPAVIRDLEGLGTMLGARRELTDHLWEDAAGA